MAEKRMLGKVNFTQSDAISSDNWEQSDVRIIGDGRFPIVANNVAFELMNTSVGSSTTTTTATTTTTIGNTSSSGTADNGSILEGLIVPLYAIIFLLSVIGNCLVLVTLARNKRMRTVTNVYLLNLAVSDLLLGVFCMPFTLLGQILKNFVFGLVMCKLIPYFQAVSVSVGVWTLVAISLERYFAICRPLKSRRWQTQFHAYKMIALVWAASLTWNSPILVVSTLRALRGGRQKCREDWPSIEAERIYNIFLDGTLLLVPLIVMSLAYSLIATKLWRGMKREIRQSSSCKLRLERVESSAAAALNPYTHVEKENSPLGLVTGNGMVPKQTSGILSSSTCHQASPLSTTPTQPVTITPKGKKSRSNASSPGTEFVKLLLTKRSVGQPRSGTSTVTSRSKSFKFSRPDMLGSTRLRRDLRKSEGTTVDIPVDDHSGDTNYAFGRQHAIRSNYMGKSIEAKKKVIRMLFVVVLEFFLCWAPLYVVNTWYLYDPKFIYHHVGSTGISLVQLLAYVSSCCNPITYCFMNRKFRQSFLSLFDCWGCWRLKCLDAEASLGVTRNATQPGNSELSGNESTIYLGRTSVVARSEVVRLLEEENRV
ncbi:cholecystokinin receptor type A-like [Venturia canescens]|uniref:cholecystokinin receptor type A-like n=1 Tax=Venturia canescens TaxID=32260 RepID=UPI001C9D0A4F|nr:cholecystokinin receptor type A-like [Venturia canescens]XP_043266788.1 cholecystokinin receptor type A-like [Venturia canescens]